MNARAGRGWQYWLQVAILAGAYVVAAKVGLALSVAYRNATPVWAPTGIALAAVLLWGPRVWPGIALGAFYANATTPVALWIAGVIAAGNTLEALLGAYLLDRVARLRLDFGRVRDVLALPLIAPIAAAVSASIGVGALLIGSEIPTGRAWFAFRIWWLGDFMGAMLVALFILTWGSLGLPSRIDRRRVLEAVLLVTLLVTAAWLVFFGGRWRYPYLVFPPLVWAAMRFRQRGAATASLAVTAAALWGTLSGSLPVAGGSLRANVEILQLLMALVSATTLGLAASPSERERGEGDLNASLSLLQATLDSTADGILVVDTAGRVVSFNRRFVEMWAIPEELMEMRDDERLLTYVIDQLESPDEFLAKVHELYQSPRAESFDTISFKDGRIFERYSRPQTVAGETIGRVWSFRDVTERVTAERFRDEFIGNAAHELRTPITTMVGFARLIEEEGHRLSKQQMDVCLDGLARQGKRVEELVSNLLDLDRFRRGKVSARIEPIALGSLVGDVIAHTPPPEGVTLRTEVGDAVVAADRTHLDQILSNLLANAYRYGGANVTLKADAPGDGVVEVSVSDDGAGLPFEIRDSAFDAFKRGSNAAGLAGSGLGLAIVKMLAEASGGSVGYRDGSPTGAVFTVTLRAGRTAS